VHPFAVPKQLKPKVMNAQSFFAATLGLMVVGLGSLTLLSATMGSSGGTVSSAHIRVSVQPIPEFVNTGVDYLATAQFDSGGWGAGTHANQGITDPHAVQIDPATTAFAGMALLRAGNTLTEGKYSSNVKKAMEFLLDLVEETPDAATNITTITGTQPQVKLGRNVDVNMTVQFLTRLHHSTDDEPLQARLQAAIDKCVKVIGNSQNPDGSFAGGSWAPVLQSAMANNALESAYNLGFSVDTTVLNRSRDWQAGNVSTTGDVSGEASPGVSLYTIASTGRASATQASDAVVIVEKAKEEGLIDKDAEVDEKALRAAGVSQGQAEDLAKAYKQSQQTTAMLQDDNVLRGFGNNGGEEFLSFMMTSESLVLQGGKEWEDWNKRMLDLLSKVQNPNGSWSGHHCITSPVFCTAAAILTLTTDRDAQFLATRRSN
jgi:hypothetical protein